ncbi:Rho termination factor N-terminal domain-containing protein [Leifsonia poae]|uniref:Rho termination factor N-terminal domain-containing protein n=1 Tax=Leifsonia poae TaxID=110933 RepID=UPI003D68D196
MAKQKMLEKAAEKALKRAEKAVDQALEAVERLDKKKAKKRAKAMQKELADAVGRSTTGTDDAASSVVDLTPPLPSVRDQGVEETVEFAGSVTTSAPHDPELDGLTVQALRDVARTRGLRNVSKLSKGQLIERLSE